MEISGKKVYVLYVDKSRFHTAIGNNKIRQFKIQNATQYIKQFYET